MKKNGNLYHPDELDSVYFNENKVKSFESKITKTPSEKTCQGDKLINYSKNINFYGQNEEEVINEIEFLEQERIQFDKSDKTEISSIDSILDSF